MRKKDDKDLDKNEKRYDKIFDMNEKKDDKDLDKNEIFFKKS